MPAADHPDRLKWNARWAQATPAFAPHALVDQALAVGVPDGPALDLACGPSGSALALAAAGRRVTAVDVSEVALDQLGREAVHRGLDARIERVHAALEEWRPPAAAFALVLCVHFWTPDAFAAGAAAVAPGGLLAWEALTLEVRRERPSFREEWCLRPGEPAARLPPGFTVLDQRDVPPYARRLLARRAA